MESAPILDWVLSSQTMGSLLGFSGFDNCVHAAHYLVCGVARCAGVIGLGKGLLHLGTKPLVVTNGLLLGFKLRDEGV
jgi:hypothetical protein